MMSSENRDNFTYSFPVWVSFISFSPMVLARISSTGFIEVKEQRHPVLFLIVKGKH